MPLTKFDFLNKCWDSVQNSNSSIIRFNYPAIAQRKEVIMQLANSIEVTLTSLPIENTNDFFKWDFEKIWSVYGYDIQFEVEKETFLEKAKRSLDINEKIDLKIKELEIKDKKGVDYLISEMNILQQVKLGYLLAINGENPMVGTMIFNLKGYYFDTNFHEVYYAGVSNLYERVFINLTHNSFVSKMDNLHKVCEGFSRAKMVYFLKDYKREIRSKKDMPVIVEHTKTEKLNWRGNKNQLYAVLRQLKNDYELIGNSYNSLADFLIQNVTGFENTKKETIEKELKKKQPLPHAKRVSVNVTEEE